jgi:hypothetical protein
MREQHQRGYQQYTANAYGADEYAHQQTTRQQEQHRHKLYFVVQKPLRRLPPTLRIMNVDGFQRSCPPVSNSLADGHVPTDRYRYGCDLVGPQVGL